MLSVLAQRSFVELTRLFGAGHPAEGQKDLPMEAGAAMTAEVPETTDKSFKDEAARFLVQRFLYGLSFTSPAISIVELWFIDISNIPPLTVRGAALLKSLNTVEFSVMLPHGFLSMHLHIAIQSSICHHPDLPTTFILMESMGNAIADF